MYLLWMQLVYGVLALAALLLLADPGRELSTWQLVAAALWAAILIVGSGYHHWGITKGDNRTRLSGFVYTAVIWLPPLVSAPGLSAWAVALVLLQLYLLRHRAVREWCQPADDAVEQRL